MKLQYPINVFFLQISEQLPRIEAQVLPLSAGNGRYRAKKQSQAQGRVRQNITCHP